MKTPCRGALFFGLIIRLLTLSSFAIDKADPVPSNNGPIPSYPIDWSQDVQTWWEHHPLNPKSPKPFKDVVAWEPRINVAEVRAKNPKSTTAGIEEALQMLPKEGGTLWFPKEGSPYIVTKTFDKAENKTPIIGAILVLRKNNIGFVSDGAEIRSAEPIFAFSSMDFFDFKKFQNPSHTFYFKQLIFNGDQKASSAMLFNRCRDVLIDGCTFKNYVNAPIETGMIRAETKTENLWCRQCKFESGRWAILWRGVHAGGAINCTFGPDLPSCLTFLEQDEVAETEGRQPCSQYIVVANSTFIGKSNVTVALYGSNCLVMDNMVENTVHFVRSCGRWVSWIQYTYFGNRIVNNTIKSCETFLEIEGFGNIPNQVCEISGYIIRNNDIASLENALILNPREESILIRDLEMSHNKLYGPFLPKIRVLHLGVANIRITDNDFSGQQSDLLVGPEETLPESAVIFENNRINNSLKP